MNNQLALEGVTVIEICNVAAGPFCGMLLADMGADVIKIENPEGGDSLRSWPPITDGFSENFASLNRNKRSITLNLKDAEDVRLAKALIGESDVLIENNRPGVMDRLGIGYAAFEGINPRLLYCSISAYGQSGPRSQEGGFDLTLQAMSGIMSITGEPGGAPVKCGVPLADFSAGLYAAFSIAAELRRVAQSGRGSHIDISMLGATLGIAALQTSEYFGSGRDPVKMGSAHPRNAPYQVFRCRDGYFGMAAGNNALWAAVCRVLGHREWADDDRFTTPSHRARHQDQLTVMLETIFADEPAPFWLAQFRAAGVPCAPINNYSDVLADPQVEHMQWIQPLTLPNGVETRTFGSPINLSGHGLPIRRAPPGLGEHSEEIIARITARDAEETQ